MQTLEAYQADLDTNAAISLVQKLERDRQTAVRPLPTPSQVALALMTGMRTATGGLIHWPVIRSGQRYAPIIRATRFMLERIFKKRVILEGTPRGNEMGIEVIKIAANIMKSDTASQQIGSTQSTGSQSSQTQGCCGSYTPRRVERSPWPSGRRKRGSPGSLTSEQSTPRRQGGEGLPSPPAQETLVRPRTVRTPTPEGHWYNRQQERRSGRMRSQGRERPLVVSSSGSSHRRRRRRRRLWTSPMREHQVEAQNEANMRCERQLGKGPVPRCLAGTEGGKRMGAAPKPR